MSIWSNCRPANGEWNPVVRVNYVYMWPVFRNNKIIYDERIFELERRINPAQHMHWLALHPSGFFFRVIEVSHLHDIPMIQVSPDSVLNTGTLNVSIYNSHSANFLTVNYNIFFFQQVFNDFSASIKRSHKN